MVIRMDPELVHVLELALALLAALTAWWQHRGKAGAERRSSEIISFYDPATGDNKTPVPPGVPDRSWQMPAATRVFLVRGLPREEQEVLLGQVERAEQEGRVRYAVSSPSAWYEIEYGLVKAGGRRDDLLLPTK